MSPAWPCMAVFGPTRYAGLLPWRSGNLSGPSGSASSCPGRPPAHGPWPHGAAATRSPEPCRQRRFGRRQRACPTAAAPSRRGACPDGGPRTQRPDAHELTHMFPCATWIFMGLYTRSTISNISGRWWSLGKLYKRRPSEQGLRIFCQ